VLEQVKGAQQGAAYPARQPTDRRINGRELGADFVASRIPTQRGHIAAAATPPTQPRGARVLAVERGRATNATVLPGRGLRQRSGSRLIVTRGPSLCIPFSGDATPRPKPATFAPWARCGVVFLGIGRSYPDGSRKWWLGNRRLGGRSASSDRLPISHRSESSKPAIPRRVCSPKSKNLERLLQVSHRGGRSIPSSVLGFCHGRIFLLERHQLNWGGSGATVTREAARKKSMPAHQGPLPGNRTNDKPSTATEGMSERKGLLKATHPPRLLSGPKIPSIWGPLASDRRDRLRNWNSSCTSP